MKKLLYEELTEKIRQAAFEVHEYFGNGFLEKVYENALCYKLKKMGIHYAQQHPLNVYFEDDYLVGQYFADILVENKIIIELKAVNNIDPIHFTQIKHYLRATTLRLGLLINFGNQKIEFKRIIL